MPLNYAAQQAILTSLTPLAEQSEKWERALQECGWISWSPLSALEQSFSQSDAEASEWRTVTNEITKVRICTPNIRYGIYGPPYASQILEDRRKIRDRDLGHSYSSKTDPVWLKELDPCRQRMERFRVENPGEYSAKLGAAKLVQEEFRISEADRHGEANRFSSVKPADISECYRDIMDQHAKFIGFEFDKKRSVRRAVYSRQLTGDWHLCLSPEPLAWHVGINEGDVLPLLSLQNQVLKGSLRAASAGSYTLVEYDKLVCHFELAYRVFKGAVELNVILKARLFLLGSILSQLERLLAEGLRKYT